MRYRYTRDLNVHFISLICRKIVHTFIGISQLKKECGVHWCDAPAFTRTLAGNKVGIKRATCLTIRRVVRANSLFVHEAQPPSKLGRLKNGKKIYIITFLWGVILLFSELKYFIVENVLRRSSFKKNCFIIKISTEILHII